MPKIRKTARQVCSLRQRDNTNGGKSLYLDYTVDGKRVKEYIKLYLVPERTRADREANEAALTAAEAIRSQRILDITQGKAGIRARTDPTLLSEWMDAYAREARGKGEDGTACRIASVANRVRESYDARLGKVDLAWVRRFIAGERERGLSESTVSVSLSYVRAALHRAVTEGRITENPCDRLARGERPRIPESQREFLTLDEVRRLAGTPLGAHPEIKSAFLFSCFTGLRISDVKALTWNDIEDAPEGGRRIRKGMEKTKDIANVPLSENALRWMPARVDGREEVFSLPSHTTISRAIEEWAEEAGIGKKVTFHVARHTFATLLLTYGTDIYTVSALLGHSSVAVTQVYAKVVDLKRRQATDCIPGL